MNKNPLLDEVFLEELYRYREKEVFAKLIALTLDEHPIEELQGQVIGGSVSIDGSSNVRRSCNLSMVAKEIDINSYYWGLKNKFKLYIGLRNTVGYGYDDIIWFPMGIYVISNFSTSQSTNNYTISITGKDKMSLINGELSGSLFASVDFGKEESYDNETKITTITDIPIKDIIKEAVHEYANEPWENIIINDLDDYGLELLEYNGSKPMYLFLLDAVDNTKEVHQTGWGEQEVLVETSNGIETITLDSFGSSFNSTYKLDLRTKLNYTDVPTTYEPTQIMLIGDESHEKYTVSKIEKGETCGYRLTDITYAGDLILNIGESITAMLDKLVAMLGNFEYFYDINGKFIFQRKPIYIDKTWNNIRTGNQNWYVTTLDETYVESATYSTPLTWTFGDNFLVTAISNSPLLTNIKNDFSIWGTKKSITGTELPVHLRYAVDKRPKYYKTLKDNRVSVNETENGKGDGDYAFRSEKIFITYDYYKELESLGLTDDMNENNTIICDWREIIFQMALDYRQHSHHTTPYKGIELIDEYSDKLPLSIRLQNGKDENGEWRYPSGKTGYEQYYTDLEGFWRQLYCPSQFWKDKYPSGVWTEREQFSTSTGITYHLSADVDGEWINNWTEDQALTDGWNEEVLNSPSTLNFWFDFLDADKNADITKYSIPAIGDRAKSVNDDKVKAIYFRDTPTVLYTTDISTLDRKSGYSYIQYQENMAGLFNISSQGKCAVDVMEEYLNIYLYAIESVSITSVPIYHLQPNTRVLIYDVDSKINGEYLVNRISIPLTYNGTMSVSATKAPDIIY